MNPNPKILVVGTGSLLNYGCEAIVQGTYEMLRENWPEASLTVASDDLDYDRKLFEGCEGIKFVPYRKRFTVYRLLMGILRRFGIGNGSPVRMNTGIIKDYDIFLSAGGDNYAEAPDGTLYHILRDLMKIGDKAATQNRIFVLWGASVGPFSKDNIDIVKRNLSKADILFPREQISYDYLKNQKLQGPEIITVADPAFCMETRKEELLQSRENEIIIGLNISRLSVDHSFRDKDRGEIILFQALDSLLHEKPNLKYLCIPHVMTDRGGLQDDIDFMNRYIEHSVHKERISILEFGIGAKKTKEYISQCNIIIAARMHCCIAGISSATPTLFLTYSHKGTGMARYAYGNEELTINLKEITAELLKQKVDRILDNEEFYRRMLSQRVPEFKDDSIKAVIKLKEVYFQKAIK
jgi:colanic acid/amylovoran biosynthesis protein